ncbi:MAG: hypothetical protein JW940_15110 [Polyangiaceae bacterium]|nr:hypothetical protein [Polyangiaceae bacterium]
MRGSLAEPERPAALVRPGAPRSDDSEDRKATLAASRSGPRGSGWPGQATGALVAAAVALCPMLVLWGFTVDDAFIAPRVAWHIAHGQGYRFNASGPVVDAVTPLGWAVLLAPWARSEPLSAWSAARWLGAACWLIAAGWLGARLSCARKSLARFILLLMLAVCAPLAAWATSGMETGLVTLLATLALTRQRFGPFAAGLAAGLRPELLPWAVVLCGGRVLAARGSAAAVVASVGLAAMPAIVAGTLRWQYFGQAAPLSVIAKPSDVDHGVNYALRALLWCGPTWLLAAPRGLWRVSRDGRVIAVAIAAHIGAVVLAGGDWMALFRLFVPVLPGALLVAGELAETTSLRSNTVRILAAVVACGFVWVTTGRAAREVAASRLSLVAQARPVLAGAHHVGALDVGWVGFATAADVFDLAGVTDPTVARLRGGHTSKHVTESLLQAREVDALVLMLAPREQLRQPWTSTRFARPVEARVASLASWLGFEPVATLGVSTRAGPAYVVLWRPNARQVAAIPAESANESPTP